MDFPIIILGGKISDMENEAVDELAKRYNLDLKALKEEQIKLAKSLKIKDAADFSAIERIGAIENICIKNKIISAMVVCDKNYEIIEQEYFFDKLRFPYLHDFRSYREVPAMIAVYNKLTEKPDVVFIHGHGICHPRLGIASHFSVAAGIPSIGVSDNLPEGNNIKGKDVFIEGKKVGRVLASKEGSRPLYICPGNLISIESAYELVKNMIVEPHKMPEPMHLAHKYAKEVQKELKLN